MLMKQVPKYQILVDWIMNKINTNELIAGDKLNSENELSSMFNMSRQTVRHAIGILEKDGIMERRRGSGNYIKNKTEPIRITNTMNIVIVTTYVDGYIFPSIIKGIEGIVSQRGYTLQIVFTHNRLDKEYSVLKQIIDNNQADGIIIEATKSGIPNPNIDLYNEIIRKKIPIMFINSYHPQLKIPHITMDDKAAGYMATKYLIDAGHQNIAGIFKADDGQGHLRYAGYLKALLENNLKIRDEYVIWIDSEDIRDINTTKDRILTRLKTCTGCLCYNDEVTYSLIGLCRGQGINIPEQLSIVSVDNSDLAAMCDIPFTSVAHPMKELGKKAADYLLRIMSGEEFDSTYEFMPQIIERSSVKRL